MSDKKTSLSMNNKTEGSNKLVEKYLNEVDDDEDSGKFNLIEIFDPSVKEIENDCQYSSDRKRISSCRSLLIFLNKKKT